MSGGLRVIHVTSEIAPFSKTGGLADVCASLPRALVALGHAVWVVTPLYARIDRSALQLRAVGLGVPMGGDRLHADVWEGRSGPVPVFFLDPPGFFDRPYIYGPPDAEYPDNPFRFAFLARGALELAAHLELDPDVFHAHDWPAGLLPVCLQREAANSPVGRAASVFTVHNVAYQGNFAPSVLDVLGLGADLWGPHGLEFHGRLSYLKAGILFADRLSTVSPTYAKEIQTPELGYGLDGLIRERAGRLRGILNGIDTEAWDASRDPYLPARYTAEHLEGKAVCKAALQEEVGLPVRSGPALAVVISRLVSQKGWDLFAPVADAFLAEEVQMVVLGEGSTAIEDFFRDLERRYPHKVRVRIGFDEGLAHRMEAGADLLIMPSRYEPCGLNQMYSLRYGTIPVVRGTGGLEDTVVDVDENPLEGNGFKFRALDPQALLAALRRALERFRDRDAWQAIMRRAMARDFSWGRAAREYVSLYEEAIGDRG